MIVGFMLRTMRASLVAIGAFAVFAVPAAVADIRPLVTPGGIKVWFVSDKTVPLIAVSFAFKKAGTATDPAGREGLAEMTAALLDEGAGDLDSQAFQREAEEIAVRISFDAGTDNFLGRMTTIATERDRAFELFRLALTKPRFDAEPIDRVRAQTLAGLKQEAENPSAIGRKLWRNTVFSHHPYARPASGTEASIQNISREDLVGFVADRFGRDRLMVGVVGDIAEDELVQRIDALFGALPAKTKSFKVPEIAPQGAGKTIIVRKPIPQSLMSFGHAGIKRDDPDWYAAYLVTRILGGGGLSSRLYEEVREKRGLAYSVYAYLNPMDHSAVIGGGTATQNARAGESLEVIRSEWRKMAEKGITEDELRYAKAYANGSFPLRLGSRRELADMLAGIQLSDLGIDYIGKRPQLIDAVTLEQANRVAGRLFRADDLTVVVVGDPKGIVETK